MNGHFLPVQPFHTEPCKFCHRLQYLPRSEIGTVPWVPCKQKADPPSKFLSVKNLIPTSRKNMGKNPMVLPLK